MLSAGLIKWGEKVSNNYKEKVALTTVNAVLILHSEDKKLWL